jgi:2-dehydro-3-deoxyphosphogluconate aldolase/(4S)-4-hydroxy-2-oxoglutarate aldolase
LVLADPFAPLGRLRLVPVVEIEDPGAAAELGDALVRGGLPCAEITFRTDGAAAAIASIRQHCPDVLVGAGTVLTVDQADAAVDAGAAFLVAPGFSPRVVERAASLGVPMIPGVSTPTEIEAALALGLTTLKFFPAEVSGGTAFLKAVSGVYRAVRFVPTGGIGPENLGSYLALPNVLACGGSWMVQRDLINARRFEAIEAAVRDAVALATTAPAGVRA